MSSQATTTYRARVKRALEMKNGDQLWVAMGRTTAWPEETSPPAPLPGATDIDEAIAFGKPVLATLARIVSEAEYGQLTGQQRVTLYLGGEVIRLGFVADGDAMTQSARFLYYRAVFNPALGHPAGPFRQVGIFSSLVPAAGYENADVLAPAHVQDRGLLEYIDHCTVVNMGPEGPVVCIHGAIEFK
ncbi:MAG: hypothetical protein AB1646_23910 [Thermodesulfobacteriota bacterium]